MAKITYTDKVNLFSQPVPNENKVTAENLNEIKTSVNQNVDDIALLGLGNFTSTGDIKLNEGKKIIYDNDGDGYSFTLLDIDDVYGFGANDVIHASLSNHRFIDGDQLGYTDIYAKDGNFTGDVQSATLTPTSITTGNIPYKSAGALIDSPISTNGTSVTLTGNLTTGASLISTNVIADGFIAKTFGGNFQFKTNSGALIALFRNDLETNFYSDVSVIGNVTAVDGIFSGNVGIGTVDPKATLHVAEQPADANAKDGIIIPRLTLSELQTKTYTIEQEAILVYIKDVSGTPAGQTININAIGFYYLDNQASPVWQKISPTLQTLYTDAIANAPATGNPGQTLLVTSDGLSSGSVTEEYEWDGSQWKKIFIINDQSTSSSYIDIGNVRMQWGTFSSNTDGEQTVNLAVPFANTNYSISLQVKDPDGVNTGATGIGYALPLSSSTASSFTVDRDNDVSSGAPTISYIAIGEKN